MSPKKIMRKMNPPTSTSSSSKTLSSSVPSISKPLDESDNEEEYLPISYTSQKNELAAQAERIASLEALIRELISNQSNHNDANESINTNLESNKPALDIVQAEAETNKVTIDTRSVPKKNYLITSASVSKMLLANRIHASTTDSFLRISMIRGALTTAGLKYLVDGDRVKPIPSPTNRFGYSERNIITVDSIDENTGAIITNNIMIDEDDCFCYDYDCGRLYQAVIEIFGETLHYLVPKEIESGDGQGIYRKIMMHLNGQRAKDAENAREIFNNYKMNENITFKMEHARFSEVFKNLEYAQKRELTSAEKLQFLGPKMIHDNRIGLKDVILQSTIHDWNYDQTVSLLIKVNSGLGETDQTVKMAAINNSRSNYNSNNNAAYSKSYSTSSPTPPAKLPKYCFLWNETGSCRFNESCRYDHIRDPNHAQVAKERNLQRENDNKYKSNDSSHSNSHLLTKSNRSTNDSDLANKKNNFKRKNHNSKMKSIKNTDETTSIKIMKTNSKTNTNSSTSVQLFSSWGDVNQTPFTPIILRNQTESLAMINCAITAQPDDTFTQVQNQNDMAVVMPRPNAFDKRSRTLMALHYIQMKHARRSGGLQQEYHEKYHNLPIISQERFFKRYLPDFKYPCNAEYDTEDGGISSQFTGFGWNPRCIVSGIIKDEIRNPSGSFMELIYRANELIFYPIITHAIPIKKSTRDHSGSFDILRYTDFRTRWYPQGSPGAYHSTITKIRDYITIIKIIKKESIIRLRDDDGLVCFGENTVKLLLWGLCFDFMSFCACQFGTNLEVRGEKINDSRHKIVNEIMKYPEELYIYENLRRCLISIASTSKGQPCKPTDIKCYDGTDDESTNQNNNSSSDESDSESETEYKEEPINQKRKCARMSVYHGKNKSLSTQRKFQFQNAESIKFENNKNDRSNK